MDDCRWPWKRPAPKRSAKIWLQLTSGLGNLVILFMLLAAPTAAREVPFPTEHPIESSFDGATSVYAADVDGDGDWDILGAATAANSITWWANDGSGGGWSPTSIASGNFGGAASVYAADIDGDGDLDALGAASADDDVTWWENDGTGSSWTLHPIADGSFGGAASVYAADIDGDGDLDVLGVASTAGDVIWWENDDGDGSAWTEHTVDGSFGGAASIHAADMDGDGDLDLLGAAETDNAIAWWENTNGDGSTWTEVTVDSGFGGAASVYAADVDGDGDLDLLGAAETDNAIAWWENTNGDGSAWTEVAVDNSFGGAVSVYAADVDGDGDLDLLGAAETDNAIAWWENTNGSGSAWTERTVDGGFGGAASVYAADVDSDGDLDLLGAASLDDSISWWENETIHRSAIYPTEYIVNGAFSGAYAVHADDIDGDGDIDILGAAGGANDIIWWENINGNGTELDEHTVVGDFSGAIAVYSADLDSDGDQDILGAAFYGNDITWWENTNGDGSDWTAHPVVVDSYYGAGAVYAADMDGDGDLDILGAAYYGAVVTWWENASGDATSLVEHQVSNGFGHASSVRAADLDSDGDLDFLGAAEESHDVIWWENTGPCTGTGGACTNWIMHVVDPDFLGARSVRVADMDRDGDLDILGAARDEDSIVWWANNGSGTGWSSPHPVADGTFDGARTAEAADLDGDGDLDVVGSAAAADAISWWENDGTGDGWTLHAVTGTLDGARWAYVSDIDGDGKLDALGAAREANTIAWWVNRGGQFALATADTAPLGIASGQMDDLLQIRMNHKGRTGDTDEELSTFDLLLEEAEDDPLTSAEANAIIENLHIYLDDGDETFEEGTDTLVTSIDTLDLTDGRQTVPFADQDTNVQISYGVERMYFVVTELTADADQQTPHQFRITHVTEESSTAEDRDHNIPLTLEYVANVSSGIANADPTAITLVSFDAMPQGDAIIITWETASEINNLGFDLFRAESPEGPQVQLNQDLIPSQAPGSPTGATYDYLDQTVTPDVVYYYWLEDVDIYGTRTRHGPIQTEIRRASHHHVFLPIVRK
jgi:hypothetical protein